MIPLGLNSLLLFVLKYGLESKSKALRILKDLDSVIFCFSIFIFTTKEGFKPKFLSYILSIHPYVF